MNGEVGEVGEANFGIDQEDNIHTIIYIQLLLNFFKKFFLTKIVKLRLFLRNIFEEEVRVKHEIFQTQMRYTRNNYQTIGSIACYY